MGSTYFGRLDQNHVTPSNRLGSPDNRQQPFLTVGRGRHTIRTGLVLLAAILAASVSPVPAKAQEAAPATPPACLPAGQPCLFSAERWQKELAALASTAEAVRCAALKAAGQNPCPPDYCGPDGCGGTCECQGECLFCVSGTCKPGKCDPTSGQRMPWLPILTMTVTASFEVDTSVMGRQDLYQMLTRQQAALKSCHATSATSARGKDVTYVFDMDTNSEGKATEVRFVRSTIKDNRMEQCLKTKLKAIRYPKLLAGKSAGIRNVEFVFKAMAPPAPSRKEGVR